ncbi:unnamed protein product [Allacma fusca]|uniref:Uncharacterized protein n=1 Tax=Allacma fusca TaxID=39272 RepID=A0A8J2L377_9HEXA|nr:unnamed protein product [Allacma fusca]
MSNKTVEDELRKLFAPYNYYKELGGSSKIFRPFICLGGPNDIAVPNRNYSTILSEVGLGYKLIPINVGTSIEQLRHDLCFHYVRFNLLPFDFMRICSGAPGEFLTSIPVREEEIAAVNLFASRNQIVYLRPRVQII